jgi:hypothetical protein
MKGVNMNNKNGYTGTMILIYVAFFTTVFGLMGLWTERNLEFYFSHFKGVPVDIPYWLSVVLSIVLNAVIFGANIIAEIVKFFL